MARVSAGPWRRTFWFVGRTIAIDEVTALGSDPVVTFARQARGLSHGPWRQTSRFVGAVVVTTSSSSRSFASQAGSLRQCACEGVELAGWKSLSVLDVSTVTERNCVAARRGGEHREVNDQSVTSVNSIRPIVVASLLENAKPKTPVDPRRESRSHDRGRGRPQTKRNHIKSGDDRGGWRRNDRKIQRDKQGDLPEQVAASREKVARGRRGHTPTGLAPIR